MSSGSVRSSRKMANAPSDPSPCKNSRRELDIIRSPSLSGPASNTQRRGARERHYTKRRWFNPPSLTAKQRTKARQREQRTGRRNSGQATEAVEPGQSPV